MSRKKKNKKNNSKKDVFLYDDHKLVTRRDFLSAGLIQYTAFISAPTLLSVLLRSTEAKGAVCTGSSSQVSTMTPMIQLHLAGGAGMASNYVPRMTTGAPPSTLDLMGLGTLALIQGGLQTEMGVTAGFAPNSGFLAGMRSVAQTAGISAAAANYLSNTAFVAVPLQSRDDSNTNPMGIASLVNLAGFFGTHLNVLTGQSYGAQPAIMAPPTPLQVSDLASLANAVGISAPLGGLANGANKTKLTAVFRLIERLSISQASRLLASNATEAQDAIDCATTTNTTVAGQDPPPTSPITNPDLAAIWGINANNQNSREAVFAGCAYNTLIGQAGVTQLGMGGYDYHNNTRTTGDAQDQAAGQATGRLLQTAASLNKPLFLVVNSDGAVRSVSSTTDIQAPWVSDRGQAGCMYVLMYDPSGRPQLDNSNVESGVASLPNQINYFTAGQAADPNYLGGWDVERAMIAVFANYMKFSHGANWHTQFNSVLAQAGSLSGRSLTNLFSNQQLDYIMRVA